MQAPGYSQVIQRPMSFSQMQTRMLKGEYATWDVVQADLETMFNNAMVFNLPTTPYHQKVTHSFWELLSVVSTSLLPSQLSAWSAKSTQCPARVAACTRLPQDSKSGTCMYPANEGYLVAASASAKKRTAQSHSHWAEALQNCRQDECECKQVMRVCIWLCTKLARLRFTRNRP